ncbi:MAG: alpha/beta hydrolase [Sneathiella sp.]|nr:MAG: alpha/beta hydrolase [Sneathiella sp.]
MMLGYRGVFSILLILVVTACSPVVQQARDERPTPVLNQTSLISFDGTKLPLKTWSTEGKPAAVILALHGINDYSNAYAFPASWWRGQGITTIAYDQRGYGETEQTGVWPGQELLVRDLATLVTAARVKYPDIPIYLLGESMGGAVVMTAVTTADFPEIDGIILSAPAVWGWQSLNVFYKTVLWTAAHTAPSVKLTGRGLGVQASDNISMLRNLGADPLFIKGTRIDALYGLVGIMDSAYQASEKIPVPALLLYGAKDELVPRASVEEVVARLPDGVDIVLYQEGWHMLMRDVQGPLVWQDIADWIKKRELPSGNKVAKLPLFPEEK